MSTNDNSTNEITPPPSGASLIYRAEGTEIEFTATRVIVHSGTVDQPGISAKAAFKKALNTGDVITEGPDKGWIYCETAEKDPFLVSPEDSGVLCWGQAMEVAERGGMKLPTKEQLYAMYKARNTGGLKGTFNTESSRFSSGYWSNKLFSKDSAWLQKFGIDEKDLLVENLGSSYFNRTLGASVRGVRRYSPI